MMRACWLLRRDCLIAGLYLCELEVADIAGFQDFGDL